jgi:hypothetical protein
MGSGTMFCARNAGVDLSEPHISTKWVTLCYFRFWPLGTYRVQVVSSSGVGIPLVGGVLTDQYRILDQLPWTANAGHIIRSLIVGWGLVAVILWNVLRNA